MVTEKQVLEIYKSVFNENFNRSYDGFDIEISEKKIVVRRMYEHVPFNSKLLFKLAELIGTDNLNVDKYSSLGCETCDYGSSYETIFTW